MNRLLTSISATVATLAVACLADSARAASFTFGDFEDFLFVSQTFPGNYNITTTEGQIHNGPTPDNGPGPDSEPTPTGYPGKPGGSTNTYGNWDRGGLGGSNVNSVNTGWGDWKYGSVGGAESSQAVFSSSTTTGVTSGSKSLRMNPQLFGGTAPNYTQHLAASIGLMPDPFGDEVYTAYIANKYLAVDITMDSSEWTGTGTFVQFGMALNSSGAENSTQPLVDRFGYWDIGSYVQNTANPSVAAQRTPNFDTGNPDNPGLWDPTNFAGVTTRTLYWDYSNWQAPPGSPYTDGGTGLPGGPAPNLWYDARTFGTMSGTSGDAGYIEFNSWYAYSQGFTSGNIYFDNWRFTDTPPSLAASDGDYDDDNDVDADDIDILWHIVRQTGTDPNNNDTADLNGDSFVNEDDVDFMLAGLLDAGTNMRYGDANLSGGTPELTDYNRWRTGTGGWAGGDFDGSGGVPELNDYNLWRTGPTQFPGSVGSHGGGGPGAPLVPEPATLVLMGLGMPALAILARRQRRAKRSEQ